MKIQVVPSDKTIVLDGVAVHPCTHVDLSWIPSDVHGMFFDTVKEKVSLNIMKMQDILK